jgi:hypothetical protein
MDDMMRDFLNRLDAKIEKVSETQAEHGVLLAEVKVGYDEHHRRSLANEQMVQELRKEIAPIKSHVAAFTGVKSAVQFSGVLASLALALFTLWKHLGH